MFTLNVTYTPQVCGDGVTTGTEECDDSALVDGATADAAGAFTLGVQYVVTP